MTILFLYIDLLMVNIKNYNTVQREIISFYAYLAREFIGRYLPSRNCSQHSQLQNIDDTFAAIYPQNVYNT